MTAPSTREMYAEQNRELFKQRLSLQRQLADSDLDATERRRLERSLSDTTDKIVQLNFGLVRSYVRRFTSHTSNDDSADFESAGVVGLVRAIASYDPERGPFAQWAYRPIKREVLRAVRQADHPNLNSGDFDRRPDILRKAAELTKQFERPATAAEVAEALGLTVPLVARVLNAPQLRSMSQSVAGDDDSTSLGDLIPDDRTPEAFEIIDSQMNIQLLERYGLTALTPRELYVLVRRTGLDGEPPQTLNEIGATLNVVREAARQVEAKALAKLAHPCVLRKLVRQRDGEMEIRAEQTADRR